MDDITGKTPKQNDYKDLMSKHHERLRKNGSSLRRSISFGCLAGPVRFVNSAHSDLVQVADLAAYSVLRQFRDFADEWEERSWPPGAKLPMYSYFERIVGKFRKDAVGRVQGFGIVKVPLIRRVRWVVLE